MTTAGDAQPGCSYTTQGAACIPTIITVLIWHTNNVMWNGKKHFELFIYNENLFYAWRDKK